MVAVPARVVLLGRSWSRRNRCRASFIAGRRHGSESGDELAAARGNLQTLAARAFRRPVEKGRGGANVVRSRNAAAGFLGAVCRIDPLGFALENFDEIGRWRSRDGDEEIDVSTRLADGLEIDGQAGLKAFLLERQEALIRNLTKKMLGYALGRSPRPSDLATVEGIVEQVQAQNNRGQELVMAIVLSRPFCEKILPPAEGSSQ